LYASTSTKDKTRSDVAYVEALIGPDTIDTVPIETLRAFRDHGRARESVSEGVREAEQALTLLEPLGISLRAVTDRLLAEGIEKFASAFDKLLGSLENRRRELQDTQVGPRPG
jgi:transaldolase